MKDLLHIGTVEQVSLPDDGIENISAKIDTGADNSSIWASNIRLHKGKLYFHFFAPGSTHYRDTEVVSSAFRTTTVRNSFGHKEFRYKIRLQVIIGDHRLVRWFSLANRAHNNYPILLGKNFLKDTFIVDVSKKHLVGPQAGPSRVLIFTEYQAETTQFFKQVSQSNSQPIDYQCVSYGALEFWIDGLNTRVINTDADEDIANYSFVFFKNHHQRELSATAAEYLHYKGRPFADQEFSNYMSASKLSEYMRLSCHGLSVPLTMSARTPLLLTSYQRLKQQLGLPFVLKEIRSDKGKFNYLIDSKKDFERLLAAAPEDHIYCAQRYIPNDGFYRMYVMGKEVVLAIWRSTTPHADKLKSHLNKPRGSANAVLVPLDQISGEAQNLALRAADCMNRQIAGVDLVQDNQTGNWYLLEANNDPQIRTGSFIDAKAEMVAKYFEKELNQ